MTAYQRQLYHFAFDPHSRAVRLALGEKKLVFDEISVRYWEPDDALLRINPSGLLPILIETPEPGTGGQTHRVCEERAILEHIEETCSEPPLWPAQANERAEARRLVGWFERKFDYEVNALLLHEKMEKRLMGRGAPDIAAMRAGRDALKDHLRYFESLLQVRNWLAGHSLSYADFACAGQLSIMDYLDEINWTKFPALKTWYMVMKSRPAFRPLLNDKLPGVPASLHYKELDF
ncbi:MAG: FtsZ-binding protein FzlA [Asticcacaulis sp.]